MRSRMGCRAQSSAPRPTSNRPKPEYEAARVRAPRMQRRLPPHKGGGVGAAIGPPHPRGGRGGSTMRALSVLLCMRMSGVGPAL